jgi:GDSL-like Lipase/Acylhydrolase family
MKLHFTRLRLRVLTVGIPVVMAGALLPATTTAQTAEAYEWVALGDSYTAGVFIGAPQPALGDESRDGCDRTANSYPDLIEQNFAEYPLDRPVHLTNVSCGNATINEIARVGQHPISPVDPPGGDPVNWPQVAPQVQRAQLNDRTDVVTVGIGGNSLPLGGIFGKCVALGLQQQSCREYYQNPPEGEESIEQKYARIEDEYLSMLRDVHDAARFAKVIAVGYPAIMPEDPTTCAPGDLREFFSIGGEDVAWLRGVLEHTNEIIQRVTSHFGDRYVDVYSSSRNHDVCQPMGTKWVEGICGDAEDFWPAELEFPGIPMPLNCRFVGKRVTVVHPNASGHANTAAQVEHAVRLALHER